MELARAISLHVFFSLDFPGVKKICFVRSVTATVPAAPGEEVSRTTSWEWPGYGLGVAGLVTHAFSPGLPPSDIFGTCIAECAATWTCSAFRASMEWACSPGYIAFSAFPRIAAPPAGIAFSRFGFTAASYPRNNPWNPVRSLIPCRISLVFHSGTQREPRVDFHDAKRMIAGGDGVRLITAVLLAGQMMTPDKFLVAESCLRQ
jgi:hypothetical protein